MILRAWPVISWWFGGSGGCRRLVSSTIVVHVSDLLQRPIVAGKIQCISTATPATFATLQAEGNWPAQYFEPIQVAAASEEDAIKVLHGIKGVYEGFYRVSYSDDAIAHAVFYARNCITKRSLPSSAVDVIDEAGAAAQLMQMLAVILAVVIGAIRLIGGNANNVFSAAASDLSQ